MPSVHVRERLQELQLARMRRGLLRSERRLRLAQRVARLLRLARQPLQRLVPLHQLSPDRRGRRQRIEHLCSQASGCRVAHGQRRRSRGQLILQRRSGGLGRAPLALGGLQVQLQLQRRLLVRRRCAPGPLRVRVERGNE